MRYFVFLLAISYFCAAEPATDVELQDDNRSTKREEFSVCPGKITIIKTAQA
jgi:hypothetical protein